MYGCIVQSESVMNTMLFLAELFMRNLQGKCFNRG